MNVPAEKDPNTSTGADDPLTQTMVAWQERRERQLTQLKRDARSVFRALEGWQAIKDQADWQATVEQATEELDAGGFLIERLGAERFLDPRLLAILMVLRRRLLDESGATTAAEMMLVDMSVLAYYNVLKAQEWIGNLSILTEHEFFGADGPSAKLRDRHGHTAVAGLRVEDYVQRLAEQLLPLLDRSNRMMIRNLKALREWRQTPAPNVNIGQAGQVNVAREQTNLASR